MVKSSALFTLIPTFTLSLLLFTPFIPKFQWRLLFSLPNNNITTHINTIHTSKPLDPMISHPNTTTPTISPPLSYPYSQYFHLKTHEPHGFTSQHHHFNHIPTTILPIFRVFSPQNPWTPWFLILNHQLHYHIPFYITTNSTKYTPTPQPYTWTPHGMIFFHQFSESLVAQNFSSCTLCLVCTTLLTILGLITTNFDTTPIII